jgi:hypothetical protein
MQISKEYLLLFNALTDAESELLDLRARLIHAQRMAEELFMESEPEGEPAEEKASNA